METSFCELRNKIVINMVDGSCLGHICDMVIDDCSGKVCGLVVPICRSFFSFFTPKQELFIPSCNICRIGCDVILVEVYIQHGNNRGCKPGKPCITR